MKQTKRQAAKQKQQKNNKQDNKNIKLSKAQECLLEESKNYKQYENDLNLNDSDIDLSTYFKQNLQLSSLISTKVINSNTTFKPDSKFISNESITSLLNATDDGTYLKFFNSILDEIESIEVGVLKITIIQQKGLDLIFTKRAAIIKEVEEILTELKAPCFHLNTGEKNISLEEKNISLYDKYLKNLKLSEYATLIRKCHLPDIIDGSRFEYQANPEHHDILQDIINKVGIDTDIGIKLDKLSFNLFFIEGLDCIMQKSRMPDTSSSSGRMEETFKAHDPEEISEKIHKSPLLDQKACDSVFSVSNEGQTKDLIGNDDAP